MSGAPVTGPTGVGRPSSGPGTGAPGSGPSGGPARAVEPDRGEAPAWTWRQPLLLFAAMAVVLVAVVWFSARNGPVSLYPGGQPAFPGDHLLGGWFRFDAGWYDLIARSGYSYAGPTAQGPVAFFPAYPLLLRVLHAVTTLPVPVLGVLVTMACGAGVAVLFHRWCVVRCGPRVARTAVVVLLVYPYAWYLYGAVYADALFLLAVLAAFALLEGGHPVWAGLAGAVATAARPVGAALVLGLVAVVLMRRHVLERREGARLPAVRWRRLRPGDAGVLLSVTGLLAWMTYLWVEFDEPLAFQKVQQAPGWDQGSGPHTWFKLTLFDELGRFPGHVRDWLAGTGGIDAWKDTLSTTGLVLQGVLMLVFVALLVVVWRRIGWGYAVYAAGVLAIPLLGSKDFQGVGRYLLAAFPCIAAAGWLLADHPAVRRVWVPVSALLLVGWASAYARGYYVA